MRYRTLSALTLLLTLVIAPTAAGSDGTAEVETQPGEELAPGWYARIDTSMGRIVARLLPGQAPQAVAQFVALAKGEVERTDPMTGEAIEGPYYDGTGVYIAKAGIRFEAGDPTSTGGGGPPLWVSPREGAGPTNFHAAGRLGLNMIPARGASPYSFFITAAAQPQFSGLFPCFGVVVQGLDVVVRITEVKTRRDDRPIEPVLINKVRIFTVGDPPALAEPVSFQGKRKKFAPRPRPQAD
jgi:cyclophilin family peptidyl-prolyl cis-trans isomerase